MAKKRKKAKPQKPNRNRYTGDAYRPEFAEQARLCCAKHGFVVRELAEMLGIVRASIYRWMETHPEFKEAINEGREAAREDKNDKLRDALYHRAIGYQYKEEQWKADEGGKLKLAKRWKRHMPADPKIQMFLAKNWMPQDYQDRQQMDVNMKAPVIVTFAQAMAQVGEKDDDKDDE